jgi:hypothetical protein
MEGKKKIRGDGSMTTFALGMKFPEIFKPSSEGWIELQFDSETLLPEKEAKCVKDYLRKKGIEVRKLPLEFSENLVYIKNKDLPEVQKMFKHVNLKRLCREI